VSLILFVLYVWGLAAAIKRVVLGVWEILFVDD
jgi:hypothetical protein